jgi:hypothetical protein
VDADYSNRLFPFFCIRSGNVQLHRQWMMRSYAVTTIFVVSRVLDAIPVLGVESPKHGLVELPELKQQGPSFSPRASIVVRKTLNFSSQSLRTFLRVPSVVLWPQKEIPLGVLAFQERTTVTLGVA